MTRLSRYDDGFDFYYHHFLLLFTYFFIILLSFCHGDGYHMLVKRIKSN